jgi:hypothetical protein
MCLAKRSKSILRSPRFAFSFYVCVVCCVSDGGLVQVWTKLAELLLEMKDYQEALVAAEV